MTNIACVIKLDDNFDEESLMSINRTEFVAFIAYAPYPISCNKEYPVEISFFTDEMDVQESDSDIKELNREGDTFRYTINGYLNPSGQLDAGFVIEDEIFKEYQFLYGKYVKFKVDRINVEFLELN